MGSVRTSILEDLDVYPRTSRRPSTTPSTAKSHEMGEILGLTTIDQFPRNQGTRAVERLLALVQDDDGGAAGPADELMQTRLVVRSSTAAPRIPAGHSGS
ncbi:hypothetical protein ACIQF4_13890, partial [Pseudarthrobacter sp. NPDC092202]